MDIQINLNISSPDFWNACYDSDDIGWDLGGPTPIFVDWCNHLKLSKKICVPGSGNGYDALYFASKSHDVTAIDFAKSPINKLKKESKIHDIKITLMNNDIFSLPKELNNKFDYIVEYTCYCAIDPTMRTQYIDVMYDLLKKGGEFVGVFLPLNKNSSEGGPPFGVNLQDTINLFSKRFRLIESKVHPLSIKPRVENEQFVKFIK